MKISFQFSFTEIFDGIYAWKILLAGIKHVGYLIYLSDYEGR
jgi:hypothetical protein